MALVCVTSFRDDQRKFMTFLHDFYNATTTFCNATVHTKLAWKRYTAKPCQEYVAKWDSSSTQLAAKDAPMKEALQPTMFTEFLGNESKPPNEVPLSVLVTTDDVIWQAPTSPMLQNYNSMIAPKSASYASTETAYVASSSGKKRTPMNLFFGLWQQG